MTSLAFENVWTDRAAYEDAERRFYESLNQATLTPLADEVAKARQRLNEIRDTFEPTAEVIPSIDAGAVKFLEKQMVEIQKFVNAINDKLIRFDSRLQTIEKWMDKQPPQAANQPIATQTLTVESKKMDVDEEDDDVDLFGSDSEDDAEADKVREERLAAYNAKKSKKPTLIAKSSVILDVKPWDDETDMKVMEQEVRKIEMDGLLWGASKLVPLAFGIHKLQINCVVEDEKVSIDMLQEQMEAIEDYVQSVDVAAFNKI